MFCEKCGSELKPDGTCPKCGDISAADNMQFEDVNSGDTADMTLQPEDEKSKKKKKRFLIAGISTAAVLTIALAASFVFFFFPRQKTFDAVPEDMIEWIEEKEDDENFDMSLVTYLWDEIDKPEVSYKETKEEDIKSFAMNGMGLSAVGFVDAESHKITELCVITSMSNLSYLSDAFDYSYSELEAIGIMVDKEIAAVVLMNLFDIDEDEAKELVEKSKDEFYYEYNGTEYCISGKKMDSDLVFIITTQKDSDGFFDYIDEMKK